MRFKLESLKPAFGAECVYGAISIDEQQALVRFDLKETSNRMDTIKDNLLNSFRKTWKQLYASSVPENELKQDVDFIMTKLYPSGDSISRQG